MAGGARRGEGAPTRIAEPTLAGLIHRRRGSRPATRRPRSRYTRRRWLERMPKTASGIAQATGRLPGSSEASSAVGAETPRTAVDNGSECFKNGFSRKGRARPARAEAEQEFRGPGRKETSSAALKRLLTQTAIRHAAMGDRCSWEGVRSSGGIVKTRNCMSTSHFDHEHLQDP